MHKDEERCLIGLISGMQQSAFCRLRAIFSGTFCTRLHIAALTAAMGNIKIVRALEHANEIAVRSVLLYQVAQLVRLGGFLNDKDNAAERLGVITHANELARQHLDKRTHQHTYGLHHVTEIWRATELGFESDSALVGKTISAVTYYTDDGVIKLNLAKKLYATTVTVAEADFSSGETTVSFSNDLPSDFDAEYSVTVDDKESNFFQYDPKTRKVTWNKDAEAPSGTYQLVITDKNNNYVPIIAQINLNVYAYAAVPYDEYWKSEGVYLSGNDWKASSDEADRTLTDKEGKVTGYEHDKGAFDAVSRATTNHGLHRGSFQQSVVIHGTKDGEAYDYHPVSWSDSNNFVDADSSTYNKTAIDMTSYNITGIKYVPVKVKASDFADFSSKYTVTKNGGTLQGGYGEENLKSYTAVAAVDKDTNGLKEVTKKGDSFSFGARKTGPGSGIRDAELKTADAAITAEAKDYSGNFGEMLRVDLDNTKADTKYYGDLGGHMQTVVWKYYGPDESNTTPLAIYGTKFAADNWMHKTMGIQLGLTDSLRAKLPDGTDGIGKWTITIYALGYSDTTYEVDVTAKNLPKKVEPMTEAQRTKLNELKEQAGALLVNYDESNATPAEKALKEHSDAIDALLKKSDANTEEAKELIDEVPGLIKAVEDERKQPTKPDKPTTETKTITGTIKPEDDAKKNIVDAYDFSFEITLQDGTIIGFDNDITDAGDDNAPYWNKATTAGVPKKGIKGLFETLIGKSASDIGTVDAVSTATVSSNAIINAIKKALSND